MQVLDTVECGGVSLPLISMDDPRVRRAETWLLSNQVERVLYGANNGGLYRLLQRCSLQSAPLNLKAASVAAGLVSTQQFEQLILCKITMSVHDVYICL